MKSLLFDFDITVKAFKRMYIARILGYSIIRKFLVLAIWGVFSIIFVLDILGLIITSKVIHVCALMVFISMIITVLNIIINIYEYKTSFKKGYKHKRQIKFCENEIFVINKNQGNEMVITWDNIKKIKEERDLFLFILNDFEILIIDKNIIRKNKDMQYLKFLFKSKINNKFKELEVNYCNRNDGDLIG